MKSNPETGSRARIAAGGTFKWAGEILAPVIAHLISQGITDFYVALHADNPGVEAELERAFGQRANLTIVRHWNVAFRQAAITNMLLNMAREEGFDVFVPFDADEFYVPVDASRTLADVLNDWVVSGNGEQIITPMTNFLVPNETTSFRARTLGSMPYRVAAKPGVSKAQLNLRLLPQNKSISRLTGIPNASQTFVIGGNHQTFRLGELLPNFDPASGDEFSIKICHVPFPSRNMTAKPAMAGRARRAATTASGDESAPTQAASLHEATWSTSSLTKNQLAGRDLEQAYFTLVPDDSCHVIMENVINAGFDVDDPWCRSLDIVGSSRGFVTRHFDNDLIFEAGVTAVHAQVGHVAALYNLLDSGTADVEAVQPDSGVPSVGEKVARSHTPGRILAIQARNKELRQTVARLQQQLDDAQKVSPPSLRPSGWRSMFRWLRRQPPNSD